MGDFGTAKDPKEFAKRLLEINKRNQELIEGLAQNLGKNGLFPAGQVIEARAKEILTENNHIVTGALRRSINTQVRAVAGGRNTNRWEVEVGSFLVYARKIEYLEDGGYLSPGAEQRRELAIKILNDHGIKAELRRWGR